MLPNRKDTLPDFLNRNGKSPADAGHFHVFRIGEFPGIALPFNRRDFYKITLVTRGEGLLSYADRVIKVKDNVTVFSNPMIPYGYETISGDEQGYFCLFNEAFINNQLKTDSLARSPLFGVNGNHVLMNDQQTRDLLIGIFENMLKEVQSAYINKYELLRNYLQIIIHESLKLNSPEQLYQQGTTNSRIANLFLELLDRQFQPSQTSQAVLFKNAKQFASQLAIHPDHLNRAVKNITGKTTTETIMERVLREAKSMLLESRHDIAGIAYSLGFQHASNFITFFKRQTGQTPNHFRRSLVVIS